jgi:hypothetical protein
MMDDIVMDLQAVIVYLRMIGAVYPVAPQVSIATLERVIGYVRMQEQAKEANGATNLGNP